MRKFSTWSQQGDISCDSSCPSWKSMGICSHGVAVAEVNKKLSLFLSAKKRKKSANVTSLLIANMPKGHGQKGGAARRLQKTSQLDTERIQMNVPSTPTKEIELSSSATQPAMLLQLLRSTWYSHQCMEIVYSRRRIVHPLCTYTMC